KKVPKTGAQERKYVPIEEARSVGRTRETNSEATRERTSLVQGKASTVAPESSGGGSAGPGMKEIFGPGGMLEKVHDGYEYRGSQLEMAELVEEAFVQHKHLIVEAGTGTGKTLAYLLPAIRSGRTVVISTATKSL